MKRWNRITDQRWTVRVTSGLNDWLGVGTCKHFLQAYLAHLDFVPTMLGMEVASMSKQADGGKARAAKLTPEERSVIAKKGAEARWTIEKSIPKETHPGEIKIGDHTLACSVLENGTRVFSSRSISALMGSKRKGGLTDISGDGAALLPRFMAVKGIISLIPEDLSARLSAPVTYQPKHGGRTAYGYEATVLPDICSLIIDADKAGALPPSKMEMVRISEALIRSFAKIGVVALIDEATGYQADREKDALQKLLEIYLTEERRKWISTFPTEFFTQIYRLKGWKKPLDSQKRTPLIGKIINKIVYDQLPEGILEELRNRNPMDYLTKRRKFKHHQFLSDEIGHPDLRAHLQQLLVLMRISDGWSEFERHFIRAFIPNAGVQQELGFNRDGAA